MFRFKSIVGIGVGAGAYILAKFAVSQKLFIVIYETTIAFPFPGVQKDSIVFYAQLIFPELVEGLVLLNIDPNGKGWIDWAATKVPLLYCVHPLIHPFSHLSAYVCLLYFSLQ